MAESHVISGLIASAPTGRSRDYTPTCLDYKPFLLTPNYLTPTTAYCGD